MMPSCVAKVSRRRKARDPVLPPPPHDLPLSEAPLPGSDPHSALSSPPGSTEQGPLWQRRSAAGLQAWEEGCAPTQNSHSEHRPRVESVLPYERGSTTAYDDEKGDWSRRGDDSRRYRTGPVFLCSRISFVCVSLLLAKPRRIQ